MKLFWKFYSFLFFAIAFKSAEALFNKASLFTSYYHITVVFNSWYIVPYLLNVLNALLECIVAAYLFGFAFDLKFLRPAPIWLFYLRLLSDAFGHSFEWQILQASFYQSELVGIIGLASLIIPIVPSYIAQWKMSFNNSPKVKTP